jgi:phospholipase D1/2
MVVDDEWLRVGSSNLSNRSMGVDTEADVTFEAEGREDARLAIRAFRDRLIAEHAGVSLDAWVATVEAAGSLAAALDKVPRGPRRLMELETPEISEAIMAAAAIGDMEKPISLDVLVQGLAHDEALPLQITPQPRRLAVLGTVALVVLGMLAMWRYTPLSHLVTADSVIDIADTLSLHWWAPIVLVLAYTPACMVMFPRPLITMAAVVVFGPMHGLAYAMTGVLLAGIAGYFVGKLVHRDTVRRLAGPRLARLTGVLQRRGIIAVTLVRFVPIAPYAVVNVVMGAMRIRFHHFVLGTFLGMLPGAIAATVLSDQAAEFLRDPARVNAWLVAGAVAAFGLLAWSGHKLLGALDRRGARGPAPSLMD